MGSYDVLLTLEILRFLMGLRVSSDVQPCPADHRVFPMFHESKEAYGEQLHTCGAAPLHSTQ